MRLLLGDVILVVSVIIIVVIFMVLSGLACVLLHKEKKMRDSHCRGCPYRKECEDIKRNKKKKQ